MRGQTWGWMVLAGLIVIGTSILPAEPARAGTPPAERCADCHGKDGASTEPDVPIIGGLSAPYISDSMAAYRNRQRPCPESKYRAGDKSRPPTDMCRIAKELGTKETDEIARTLAAKPFVRAKQTTDPAKAAIGKKLHDVHCEKCHAEGGSSAADDAGILAGQHVKYLEQTFKEYADGSRLLPKKMKPKFEKLSPEDKEALLQYYASFQ